MLRILSIFTICLSVSNSTYAAPKRVTIPIPCFETREAAKILNEHKEEYAFMGVDNMHGVKNLTTILFYNKDTKTYSIILSVQDNDLACVISSGAEGNMLIKARD